MSASDYEREALELITGDTGHLVQRAAGSQGGAGDLVVIRKNRPAIIIEVKSSVSEEYNLKKSDNSWEQYKHMCEISNAGYTCMYMVRWKGVKELHGSLTKDKYSLHHPLDGHILKREDDREDLWRLLYG